VAGDSPGVRKRPLAFPRWEIRRAGRPRTAPTMGRHHERDLRPCRAQGQVAGGVDGFAEAMRASLTEIPGVTSNFPDPSKTTLRKVSGVRAGVLKISAPISTREKDARAESRLLARCHGRPGLYATRRASSRSSSTADHRLAPHQRECREDVVQTALEGASRRRIGRTSALCRCA
jgi:hypothetical protein